MKVDWLERTLCLIKPDAVRRGLVGEILGRFEKAGFKVMGMKLLQADKALAEKHYLYDDIALRHGEAVWNNLNRFLVAGPMVAFVLEGVKAIASVRKICGSTEPASSAPGTIRGDYCHQSYDAASGAGSSVRNVIHASADAADAEREISVWFSPEELLDYRRNDQAEHFLDQA
jgi:nucleoside-diphosphate kinase